jgi:hypothetical protein
MFHPQGDTVKKKILWIVAVCAALAIAAQFHQPDRTNPPADPALDLAQNTPVPKEVQAILRQACYDCHSHETVWPWYSRISPVSWMIAKDVTSGRRHLNFSLWGRYPQQRRERALEEIREQVSSGSMPLPKYAMMHAEARLDSAARKMIIGWAMEHGGSGESPDEE